MKPGVTAAARILLGIVFSAFGLNGFLHLFPLPSMDGKEARFIGGLVASGYFFPLLFVTYTITGAALLSGRFVPLALIVLAPIIVNIVCIHVFLAPSGYPLTLLVVGLALFLAWTYRDAFRPVLRARGDGAWAEAPRMGGAPQ